MKCIYDYDREKIFDIPTDISKIPFYIKLILPFLKTYQSEDFIHDNKKNELWTKTEYKKFKDKIYITKFKHYYIQRPSHLMNGGIK